MTDRLIRITTALAVVAVAVVAAIISYQHAYELVRSHGESRHDGPAAAVHRGRADLGPRPWWCWMPGAGSSLSQGWPPGASARASSPRSARTWRTASVTARSARCVDAWPALALVGPFELLMMLIRTGQRRPAPMRPSCEPRIPRLHHRWRKRHRSELRAAPTLEQTVLRAARGGPQPARRGPANSTSTAARSSASSTKPVRAGCYRAVPGHPSNHGATMGMIVFG